MPEIRPEICSKLRPKLGVKFTPKFGPKSSPEVNLKLGNDAFKCFTCDFTHDYIDINADYRN